MNPVILNQDEILPESRKIDHSVKGRRIHQKLAILRTMMIEGWRMTLFGKTVRYSQELFDVGISNCAAYHCGLALIFTGFIGHTAKRQ